MSWQRKKLLGKKDRFAQQTVTRCDTIQEIFPPLGHHQQTNLAEWSLPEDGGEVTIRFRTSRKQLSKPNFKGEAIQTGELLFLAV